MHPKNKKYSTIREITDMLKPANKDEVEFAILDPELIPYYYEEKYGKTAKETTRTNKTHIKEP